MPETIHEVIKQQKAFYEVQPYCTAPSIRAGFDIDVYGSMTGRELGLGRDYELVYTEQDSPVWIVYTELKKLFVEVITFGSRVVFDTKRQLQHEGMLRIRIARNGFHQAAGEEEERVLRKITERLHDLGISHG